MTAATGVRREALGASALSWAAGLLLASGVPLELGSYASPTVSVLAGVATTALLLLLWRAATGALAPARDALLVFASISVFGWASALITAPLTHRVEALPVAVAFLFVNGLKVISVVLVVLVARRRDWTAGSLALRPGDPRAAAGPRTGGPTLRWTVAGPVVMALTLLLFAGSLPAGALGRLPGAAKWLPVILAAALLNSAAEEFLYRHAGLRALGGVMGTTQAALLTSGVFGLAHLTGNPGGVAGVLYTAVFGLTCAHALVRARGFAWNLPIHVIGDIGVGLTLVATVH